MYAIVKTGGKQYRVERGQHLLVERLAADEGSSITLQPLLYRSEETVFDAAGLAKVKVTAKVIAHERGEKLRVAKFKPKRGYKRRNGHRQELTRIEVTELALQRWFLGEGRGAGESGEARRPKIHGEGRAKTAPEAAAAPDAKAAPAKAKDAAKAKAAGESGTAGARRKRAPKRRNRGQRETAEATDAESWRRKRVRRRKPKTAPPKRSARDEKPAKPKAEEEERWRIRRALAPAATGVTQTRNGSA